MSNQDLVCPVCQSPEVLNRSVGDRVILQALCNDFRFYETAFCRDSAQRETRLVRMREMAARMQRRIDGVPEPVFVPDPNSELWPERRSF